MDKKKKTMWFRPSFIYNSDIYYDHTLSLRRQVTNETMDIPKREIDRQLQGGVRQIHTTRSYINTVNLKKYIKNKKIYLHLRSYRPNSSPLTKLKIPNQGSIPSLTIFKLDLVNFFRPFQPQKTPPNWTKFLTASLISSWLGV